MGYYLAMASDRPEKDANHPQSGISMDALSALLQRLDFRAEVFYSGTLCGRHTMDEEANAGVLHFVKSGALSLRGEEGQQVRLAAESVIFIPAGMRHHLHVHANSDAELVCASIRIPAHQRAVLIDLLPRLIGVHVEDDPALSQTARQIFEESFSEWSGRQTVIDRLCEIFIVQILRYVVRRGLVELGAFSANAHPQLAPLMQTIQSAPEQDWSVDSMAEKAAMSRSKFSAVFKDTVGLAPMEYLTELRLSLARKLLLNNKPVSLVAQHVGYESSSSLARVFRKHHGLTPRQWLKQQHSTTSP